MDVRIVSKKEMKIAGYEKTTTVQSCQKELPALWEKLMRDESRIKSKVGDRSYGACIMISPEECSFRYIAGFEVEDFRNVPKNMKREKLPAAKYAVFQHRGKLSEIGKTYWQIQSEALPNAGLRERGFWLEAYGKEFDAESDDSVMDIWVAVE